MSTTVIRTDGLTKRFGDFTAVDALSLAVRPGTIFAFLGANGSGKSTTIRMLIGLLTPSAGAIEVDGVDVVRNPRRVRDRIGYMGQKVSLYQGITLRENAEFYGGLYGLGGRDLDARWDELRARFSLADAERERPESLPAGIRQRAGLALATLHRPRVLFLDEPTAGVDVESRGLFWDVIHDEADRGVTVFVTTHFLEEVDYCDWVSFIDEGKLVADAAPEDLRHRFAAGYRLEVDAPPALRERVVRRLAEAGVTADVRGDRVTATVPRLDSALAAALEDLGRAGADPRVVQPPMVDVFARVIAESPA
jgi:ABC-2 type transport system ATP-binding protein